jgi:hypothetical protein
MVERGKQHVMLNELLAVLVLRKKIVQSVPVGCNGKGYKVVTGSLVN